MRWGRVAIVAVVCVACSQTSTPTTTIAPTTTVVETTSTTRERLVDCAAPQYEITSFPSGISANQTPVSDLPFDQYTTVPGSASRIFLAEDGGLAMALVRGTLPPEEWPGDSQLIDIDGAQGRVGPFDDGTWVVAWFEQPGERCDRYTLVFYPPIDPLEVRSTIESMDRTAG